MPYSEVLIAFKQFPEHNSLVADIIGDPIRLFEESRLSWGDFLGAPGLRGNHDFSNPDPFQEAAANEIQISMIQTESQMLQSQWLC